MRTIIISGNEKNYAFIVGSKLSVDPMNDKGEAIEKTMRLKHVITESYFIRFLDLSCSIFTKWPIRVPKFKLYRSSL